MNNEFNELFDLRFKERNKQLAQAFLGVKQEMVRRRMPTSGETIKKYHREIQAEFEYTRGLIVKTITDVLQNNRSSIDRKKIESYAQEILSNRKSKLVQMYNSEANTVLNGLQNSVMTAPFKDLEADYPLAQKELTIELSSAIDTYEKSLGNTLTDRVRNKFMNNSIVAVFILSVAGTTSIIAILKLLNLI